MNIDPASTNATANVTGASVAESDSPAITVTYQMYLALVEKDVGKEFKAKLDILQDEIGVVYRDYTEARKISTRPIMERSAAKAQKVLDNQFAERLSGYFAEKDVTFHGGADPTMREWAANVKELESLLDKLLAEYDTILQEAWVFLAEYEACLNAASSTIEKS